MDYSLLVGVHFRDSCVRPVTTGIQSSVKSKVACLCHMILAWKLKSGTKSRVQPMAKRTLSWWLLGFQG